MDGFTLDALITEARPQLLGRHVDRVALGGPEALLLELGGRARLCLRLDASRATPGLYLLSRQEGRELCTPLPVAQGGPARHSLLRFRKHLEGRRVESLSRVPGERVMTLEIGGGVLVFRLSPPTPALTFAVAGLPLVSLGNGSAAAPGPKPEREWDRVDPDALEEAIRQGPRAVLDLCPSLGPVLARRLVAGIESVASLRRHLATPRPNLVAAVPLAGITDAQLAEPGSVLLLPFLPDAVVAARSAGSAGEVARMFLEMLQRGAVFAERRRTALAGTRRQIRRLKALEAHLAADLAGLPGDATLRRHAETLLAAPPGALERGPFSVTVPDPLAQGQRVTIPADPALSGPANADRLFAKARRFRQAREQIADRIAATRPALEKALSQEERVLSATTLAELDGDVASESKRTPPGRGGRGEIAGRARARHYLTSRGLSIRVGRGARENHQLTFGLAGAEDFWLHARDVPGAHVILQDVGGRAGPQDLREAAEIAAFFSEAHGDVGVDVHVTRRKHVRPGGSAGRVRIGHSETLRVVPRDPKGRLRER